MKRRKKNGDNGLPQENWTLRRLGTFCRLTSKNLARYGWLMGRALNVAKDKVQHGQFEKWAETNCPGVSKPTRSRYMRIARAYEWKDLDGKNLTAIYRELGMVTPAEDDDAEFPSGVDAETEEGVGDGTETDEHREPPGGSEPDEVIEADEVEDESCEEFVRDSMLLLVGNLTKELENFFKFSQAERRQAWDSVGVGEARRQFQRLMLLLNRVGREMPRSRAVRPQQKARRAPARLAG